MKYITIPNSVKLVDLATDNPMVAPDGTELEPVSFRQAVCRLLLDHPQFGESLDALQSHGRITDLVRRAEPGQAIAVEDDDHARLAQAAKKPAKGYNPTIHVQFLPFLRAIVLAEDCPAEGTRVVRG